MPARFKLILLCLVASALAAAPAVAQEAPATQPTAGEQPEDAGFANSEEELLAAADEIAAAVAEIRGLTLKGPVKKGIKKREELRSTLLAKLAEEVPDEAIESEARVYKRLGLIPADLDYKKVLLDVLTEQIAGFYDQATKELYIMQGIPMNMQRPAMAHELYHALQDQHFDILSLQEPFSTVENSDFALARSALLEGDATVVMFDFTLWEAKQLPPGVASFIDIPLMANMLANLSFDDIAGLEALAGQAGLGVSLSDSALGRAPRIFRELLVFPYFAGMRFVVLTRSGRSWADFDKVYSNPPVSTEQILHPDKYFDQDQPVHVELAPDRALPGWKKTYDSVLGEYQISLFFREHAAPAVSPSEAAAGWDGDRLLGFTQGERTIAISMSAWDTETDAREFYDALLATTKHRYPKALEQGQHGTHGQATCFILGDGPARERVYVEQWGDRVLYIEGTPSELDADGKETNPATHQLRELIWKTHHLVPFDEYAAAIAKAKAAKAAPK